MGRKSREKMTGQTLKERIETISKREEKQRKEYNACMKRIREEYLKLFIGR